MKMNERTKRHRDIWTVTKKHLNFALENNIPMNPLQDMLWDRIMEIARLSDNDDIIVVKIFNQSSGPRDDNDE